MNNQKTRNSKLNKFVEKRADESNDNLISFIIINQKGTILLSRQFSPICKSELFYHAAFIFQYFNNLSQDNKENNSFFDNKDKRYLYLTLENDNTSKEYILSILIINKNYNIFAATNILKLIKRIIFGITKYNLSSTADDNCEKVKTFQKIIHEKCYEIILSIDDIISQEGALESEKISLDTLTEYLKMDSYLENAYKIIQEEKENKAKVDLVKGIEEINRLKREHKYFDNSVSSELYNKVNEVVDQLADKIDENEPNLVEQIQNNNNNGTQKLKGMNLKKKLVENLMQIREDSIKMTNFYLNAENIFQSLENEIKKSMIAFANEESDEEMENELHYTGGITITPIHIIFKAGDSDDD